MDGLFPSSTKKPTKLEVTEVRKELPLDETARNTTNKAKISSKVPSKKFSSTIKSDSTSATNTLAIPMKKIDMPSATEEDVEEQTNEIDEDVAEDKEESEEDEAEESAKPSKPYGLAYLGRLFSWFKK